jgi:hypothetical protein
MNHNFSQFLGGVFQVKFFKQSILFFLLLILGYQQNTFAQSIGNSPFSYYGVGEVMPSVSSTQQIMGGLGVAASNGLWVNSLNPSLLVTNRYTVFEVGSTGNGKTLSDATQSQQVFNGQLDYVSLTVPMLSTRWSMSIGLRPYSSMAYEIYSSKEVNAGTQIDTVGYRYKGTGGLNSFSFGHGVRIGKALFVGAEAAYIFGQNKREALSQILDDDINYIVNLNEQYNYSDWKFKLAATYQLKLTEKMIMNVAGVVDFGRSLSAKRFRTFEVQTSAGVLVAPQDTLNTQTDSNISLPTTISTGVSIVRPTFLKHAFTLNLDYSYTPWSKYQNFFGRNEGLQDSYTLAMGAEYTPDLGATSGSFLKRTNYRLGMNYTKTPYQLGGRSVNDFSFSFGFGLPLRNASTINLGMILGSRGFTENNGIKENYYKVVLGLTLNDIWFRKYKLD